MLSVTLYLLTDQGSDYSIFFYKTNKISHPKTAKGLGIFFILVGTKNLLTVFKNSKANEISWISHTTEQENNKTRQPTRPTIRFIIVTFVRLNSSLLNAKLSALETSKLSSRHVPSLSRIIIMEKKEHQYRSLPSLLSSLESSSSLTIHRNLIWYFEHIHDPQTSRATATYILLSNIHAS